MNGNIPAILVQGRSLPEAWEMSLLRLYHEGCDVVTEYDKPGDPPSKDCSITIVVEDPLSEPMIHRDLPGGLEDLQEYLMEVIEGIKDHCVRAAGDSSDSRWEYTYHQRLFEYSVPGIENTFNQVEMMARRLAAAPHTRRAQAVTWKVWEDNTCYDPACLQSVWCRALPARNGAFCLNMNVRFRSNDAYKAAFMNMFALVHLQKLVAETIAEISGKNIVLGRYLHQADSYHLYGSYFQEFEQRFLRAIDERTFEQRTFRYQDVKPIMTEAIPRILEKASRMGRPNAR